MKVVLDACVLAGSIRRHVLLSFAMAGLFEPVWSEQILTETERAIPKTFANAREDRPDLPSHAQEIIRLMTAAFPSARHLVPQDIRPLGLPDRDDEHVVALAVSSNCPLIVTENLRDFPIGRLQNAGLSRSSSDVFLWGIIMTHPEISGKVMSGLHQRIGLPDLTLSDMHKTMNRVGLRRTVRALTP